MATEANPIEETTTNDARKVDENGRGNMTQTGDVGEGTWPRILEGQKGEKETQINSGGPDDVVFPTR